MGTGPSLYDEANAVYEAIGSEAARTERCFLAAGRGDQHEARALIEETISNAMARGQGNAVMAFTQTTRFCATVWVSTGRL